MKQVNLLFANLRLFDGGEGGGGTAAAAAAGAAGGEAESVQAEAQRTPGNSRRGKPGAQVVYGRQPDAAGDKAPAAGEQAHSAGDPSPAGNTPEARTPEEKKAAFERLIQREYKAEYDAKVQDIISRRYRGAKQARETLDGLQPLLQLLGERYQVDSGDTKALQRAVENDSSYWSKAAEKAGMPVEQYKRLTLTQRENERLRRAQADWQARQRANAAVAQWSREAESLRGEYPGLDLRTEGKDPRFIRLLHAGVGVRAAYEALHSREIKNAVAQKAAETARRQVTESIRANGARPAENGVSLQTGTVYKTDVHKLTRRDRAEIAKRAMRGESITF